jgi:hypothetical protein
MMRILVGMLLGILLVLGWQQLTVQGQAAPPFTRFAGTWSHHGGFIYIDPTGRGSDSFRTYINCSTQRQTACDRFLGNTIYPGGYLRFRLTKIGGNVASGYVTGSAYSWQMATPVKITRRANDTILVKVPGFTESGCGSQAPAGACGA